MSAGKAKRPFQFQPIVPRGGLKRPLRFQLLVPRGGSLRDPRGEVVPPGGGRMGWVGYGPSAHRSSALNHPPCSRRIAAMHVWGSTLEMGWGSLSMLGWRWRSVARSGRARWARAMAMVFARRRTANVRAGKSRDGCRLSLLTHDHRQRPDYVARRALGPLAWVRTGNAAPSTGAFSRKMPRLRLAW